MAKSKYTDEQWNEALELIKLDIPNKEISERTGIGYDCIKVRRTKLYGVKRITEKEVAKLRKKVAKQRLTMTCKEVARLNNKTPTYIHYLTKDHPDRDKFKFERSKKSAAKKPLDKERKSEPFKKGYEKIDLNYQPEVIVIKDRGQRRKVKIDSKTETFVSFDDKRTDEQIIKDFNKKFNR